MNHSNKLTDCHNIFRIIGQTRSDNKKKTTKTRRTKTKKFEWWIAMNRQIPPANFPADQLTGKWFEWLTHVHFVFNVFMLSQLHTILWLGFRFENRFPFDTYTVFDAEITDGKRERKKLDNISFNCFESWIIFKFFFSLASCIHGRSTKQRIEKKVPTLSYSMIRLFWYDSLSFPFHSFWQFAVIEWLGFFSSWK